MILTSQKGAGLIMALMLAHGAPENAPGDTPEVAEAPPMMIAAGETSESDEENTLEGAFRRLSERDQKRARRLLEAQHIRSGSSPAWSLDKIAAAHQAGKPWDRIVVELQRKRLLAAGEPEDFLKGRDPAPRAVAEEKGEELTGAIATASAPAEGDAAETALLPEISCPLPAGGKALTVAAPADIE